MSGPRIRFRFARAERSLTEPEARILVGWLAEAPAPEAVELSARLRSNLDEGRGAPMDLEAAEVAALRDVLAGAEIGDQVGLKLLTQMLSR